MRPDNGYPASTVREHVPFYIAPKSPMLYAVTSSGAAPYKAKSSDLVFIGFVLGDLIGAGLTWCISDGNASSGYSSFSRDLTAVGDFVDFDLLSQRMWNRTSEDPYRPGRRAAECLVLGEVALDLARVVITRNEAELARAREHFATIGGTRDYYAMPEIFYN